MKDRLVAHRGNAYEHRENSLEAIRSAIDLGLKFVEFDIQMSKDGVPCLLHDAYLGRLYGKDRDAVDTTFSSLSGLGIASLAEAISAIRDIGVTCFVEVKQDCFDRYTREMVMAAVCSQLTPQCVVISFDLECLWLARERGYQIGLCLGDLSPRSRLRLESISPEFAFVDQRHVTEPVWPGYVWCSWEVSDKRTADRLTRCGVDLLETMSVRRMLQC